MAEPIDAQVRAIRAEIQEIMQWLDWSTDVATRIETRLTKIETMAAQKEPDRPTSEQLEEGGPMALMEGVVVTNVTDFQAAIDAAGRAFWKRYGKPPAWVALPRNVDPASLKLWTLRLGDRPAPPGTVIVGEETDSGG